MKNTKVFVVVVTVLVTLLGTGCGVYSSWVEDLPLESALTSKEVIDYYSEAVKENSHIRRDADVQQLNYQPKDVDESMKMELGNIVASIESALAASTYKEVGAAGEMVISEESFNYIKTFLNDMQIFDGQAVNYAEALGYYFVDVEYKVKPGNTGAIKPSAAYLGIHGAFIRTTDGDTIDYSMIEAAIQAINKYWVNYKQPYSAEIDAETGLLILYKNGIATEFTNMSADGKGNVAVATPSPTPTATPNETETSASPSPSPTISPNGSEVPAEPTTEPTIDPTTIKYDFANSVGTLSADSKCFIDTVTVNKAGAGSNSYSAYMPSLEQVFTAAASTNGINGFGFYSNGNSGLNRFGFTADNLKGSITITYVFKANLLNPNNVQNISAYPKAYTLDVENISTDQKPIVPNFLSEQISILIDRADRAIVNNDMSALMSGQIFSRAGFAIQNGTARNFVNCERNISGELKILARDGASNTYEVMFTTLKQEGLVGSGSYGTFRDTYLATIEQYEDKLIISDYMLVNRAMTMAPSIDPDSSVIKRLVALGLSGEVTEEVKADAMAVLDSLYIASTNRKLHGPWNIGEVEYKRGMYECFNSDASMLSSEKLEYLNASMRESLVRFGTDVSANMTGQITTWVGGAKNQVELFTEELITYDGKTDGTYQQVYYLMSNISGDWVIDDRQVIEETSLSGSELEAAVARIG